MARNFDIVDFLTDPGVKKFDGGGSIDDSSKIHLAPIAYANPANYQQSFTPSLFSGVSSNNITGGGSSGGFDTTFDPTVGTPAVVATDQRVAAKEYVEALGAYMSSATSENKARLDAAKQALIDLDVSREQIGSVTTPRFPNGIDVSGGIEGVMGPTLKDAAGQVLQGVAELGDTAGEAFGALMGIGDHDQYGPTLPVPGVGWQWGETGKQTPIQIGTAQDGTPIVIYMPGGGFLGGAGSAAREGGDLWDILGGGWKGMGGLEGLILNPSVTASAYAADAADSKTDDSKGGVILNPGGIDETGGDGTTVLTDGSGVTNEDATDTITNQTTQTTQTDLEKTAPTVDPEKTAPTFSGSIDTTPKYGTVTTTDHIGPSLAASLGFTTEEAETLNNVLKGSLGFDTTQTDTLDNVLKGSLGFDTTQTDTLDNVLKGSLAGETTLAYDSSPHLSASLEGNVLKTTSNAPVLKGALGGGGGGGGGGMGMPSASGMRRGKIDPGPVVDIDYLYDFAKGLDQPFLVADQEDEVIKAAEGGMIGDGNKDDFERILRIVRGI